MKFDHEFLKGCEAEDLQFEQCLRNARDLIVQSREKWLRTKMADFYGLVLGEHFLTDPASLSKWVRQFQELGLHTRIREYRSGGYEEALYHGDVHLSSFFVEWVPNLKIIWRDSGRCPPTKIIEPSQSENFMNTQNAAAHAAAALADLRAHFTTDRTDLPDLVRRWEAITGDPITKQQMHQWITGKVEPKLGAGLVLIKIGKDI